VIAPMLAGCTPVGVGVDETLGLLDFELKRLGYVTAMPLGVELRGVRVTGRTALERAQSALTAHDGADSEPGSSPFEEPEPAESVSGLLVSRDHSAPTPSADHLPGLSALLRVSRDVGAAALGMANAGRAGGDTPWDAAARQAVADQLRTAAERAKLPADVVERLQTASSLLGLEIVSETAFSAADIATALAPGTRICFTGTAQDSDGRIVERWEMERLAESAGLRSVNSVTKTRCEVLVVAEAGTQSGKARKAVEYGKPVFTAEEFFGWLATR
jgi:hypothetical protein